MGFKGLYQVGLGYSHNFPLKLDGHAQDGPRAVPCLGVLRRDGLTYALHTLGQRRQPLMMEPCSSKPVPAATQSPTLAHVAVEAGVAVRVGDVERLARRRDVPRDALRDGHPRHATAARHHWGGGGHFSGQLRPQGRPTLRQWHGPHRAAVVEVRLQLLLRMVQQEERAAVRAAQRPGEVRGYSGTA